RQVDFLTSETELPNAMFEKHDLHGEFTGERLHQQNPRLYGAVVKLIAASMPIQLIADVLSISPNTVQAVRDRESIPVEREKERLGKRWRFVSELAIEGLAEDLADPVKRAKIPARDKAIIGGIGTEKSELLLGGVTARLETIDGSGPSHADYFALIAKARELKNVTPTGSAGEIIEAKGAAAEGNAALQATPEAAQPALATPREGSAIDVVTPVPAAEVKPPPKLIGE